MNKGKDEKKRYMLLTLENNQPLIDIYTGYNKDAASFYNAGNYNDALTNFKNALAVFDLIAKREIVPIKLDTTTTLYAGISAEKANKIDEAATYYGKIAEAKAQGEGFVEIYKWLADHYRRKGILRKRSSLPRWGVKYILKTHSGAALNWKCSATRVLKNNYLPNTNR
jgi:hypothetical protein